MENKTFLVGILIMNFVFVVMILHEMFIYDISVSAVNDIHLNFNNLDSCLIEHNPDGCLLLHDELNDKGIESDVFLQMSCEFGDQFSCRDLDEK